MKPFQKWLIVVLIGLVVLAAAWFIGRYMAYREIASTVNETLSTRVYGEGAKIGPYSPSVRTGNFVYVSGQIAIDPGTKQMLQGSIEQEARQALENLGAVLKNAGCGYQDVVSTTVYVKDLNDYEKINAVYASFFQEGKYPARTFVEVTRMPGDARFEINAVAVLPIEK